MHPEQTVKHIVIRDADASFIEDRTYQEYFQEILVREALPEDASDIAVLCRDCLGYECTDELIETNLKNLRADRERVFVAVYEGRTVGFIHVEKYSVLYIEPMANILGIAVDEHLRHRSIGTLLIKAGETWAKEQGITAMRLNSGAGRKGAHQFYRALGYEDSKQQYRFLKKL